ncbi:sigma-70 family RNA polymerase sigma factor [Prosthecomicrobium pneumaticum]|uniref:RNA polymerase sigma factor n=1 Tax=Prosthecomicrobium pneumaticum TaxID=81895 RepID=A0A7W9CT76_9HYPH|nr:sigma-70 family RNA polymerase sigma factor [Prosthecomicrobium pneumaticum]MBB5751402.1 RNA polymerase sigma-70 factor (ECF subfamily) [Prosthecomicrobium pneumaticum]
MTKVQLDVLPHLDALLRFARTLTGDDGDADELVQEALARALAFRRSYDPGRPLLAWLLAILRNTFATGEARRRAEIRRNRALAALADRFEPAAQEDRVDLNKTTAAFDALPLEQAEALHLVGLLGFTYRDAAELLDVPIGTVMSRLNRGRAALRAHLEPGGRAAQHRLRIVGGRDGSS